jgi:hypothetical protein
MMQREVNCCARAQQRRDGFVMPAECCKHERSRTEACHFVHSSFSSEQPFYHMFVAGLGSAVDGARTSLRAPPRPVCQQARGQPARKPLRGTHAHRAVVRIIK